MIGADKIYAPSVTSGTVGMAAVIVSLLFFIMGRSLAGPYTSVPFSVLFRIFFVLAVLIAIYYGVTMLMNVLLLKNAKSWQQILHDFSVSTTIVLGLVCSGNWLFSNYTGGNRYAFLGSWITVIYYSTDLYFPEVRTESQCEV
jgi:hypothetical protein